MRNRNKPKLNWRYSELKDPVIPRAELSRQSPHNSSQMDRPFLPIGPQGMLSPDS